MNTVTDKPEALWKVADVARFLSMSISYVYKLVEHGELPCVRFGAAVRFKPDAIRAYVDRANPSPALTVVRGSRR